MFVTTTNYNILIEICIIQSFNLRNPERLFQLKRNFSKNEIESVDSFNKRLDKHLESGMGQSRLVQVQKVWSFLQQHLFLKLAGDDSYFFLSSFYSGNLQIFPR